MIPVRCFSCNKVISRYYLDFLKHKGEGKDIEEYFIEKKLDRYCCRRMLLTQVDTYKIIKKDKVKK